MTKAELNRDIKRLAKLAKAFEQEFTGAPCEKEDNQAHVEYYQRYEIKKAVMRKEFTRLYNVDRTFEPLNKASILILLYINSKYRFIDLHRFSLSIEI